MGVDVASGGENENRDACGGGRAGEDESGGAGDAISGVGTLGRAKQAIDGHAAVDEVERAGGREVGEKADGKISSGLGVGACGGDDEGLDDTGSEGGGDVEDAGPGGGVLIVETDIEGGRCECGAREVEDGGGAGLGAEVDVVEGGVAAGGVKGAMVDQGVGGDGEGAAGEVVLAEGVGVGGVAEKEGRGREGGKGARLEDTAVALGTEGEGGDVVEGGKWVGEGEGHGAAGQGIDRDGTVEGRRTIGADEEVILGGGDDGMNEDCVAGGGHRLGGPTQGVEPRGVDAGVIDVSGGCLRCHEREQEQGRGKATFARDVAGIGDDGTIGVQVGYVG